MAGVDEAGRGPLAGPVIAAAVILDPANAVVGLKGLNLSPKTHNPTKSPNPPKWATLPSI
jgi:ribonuclease HII